MRSDALVLGGGVIGLSCALAFARAAGAQLREEWWGWRPMCVDEISLIGPVTRRNNLMLACGHGMLGVSMSAATAELVSALVAGT